MRRMKSDWRASLAEDTLDHLMRVSIDGPSLDKFDLIPAVLKYTKTIPVYIPMAQRRENLVTLKSCHSKHSVTLFEISS